MKLSKSKSFVLASMILSSSSALHAQGLRAVADIRAHAPEVSNIEKVKELQEFLFRNAELLPKESLDALLEVAERDQAAALIDVSHFEESAQPGNDELFA